jgi:hypothetical protein
MRHSSKMYQDYLPDTETLQNGFRFTERAKGRHRYRCHGLSHRITAVSVSLLTNSNRAGLVLGLQHTSTPVDIVWHFVVDARRKDNMSPFRSMRLETQPSSYDAT